MNSRKLGEFISELVATVARKDYLAIGRLMRDEGLDDKDPEWMVALLRVTFTSRCKIPEWAPFLEKARACLDERGLDAGSILTGL